MTTNPFNTQKNRRDFILNIKSSFDRVSVIQMDEIRIYKDQFI